MNQKNRIWIPQAVACLFLIGAFNPENPYGYYMILRWIVCGTFAYVAYQKAEQKKKEWTWMLGITALIYNPFIPIHLDREIWSAVNLVTILIAIFSISDFERREIPVIQSESSDRLEDQPKPLPDPEAPDDTKEISREPFSLWIQRQSADFDLMEALDKYILEYSIASRADSEESEKTTKWRTKVSVLEESIDEFEAETQEQLREILIQFRHTLTICELSDKAHKKQEEFKNKTPSL